MLRPGAAPPKKEAPVTVASFDEPAKVTTLESTNKVRLNQLILLFSWYLKRVRGKKSQSSCNVQFLGRLVAN